MKFVLYTPWVSPHQVPLAKELVKVLGVDNFRYVYTENPSPHQLKWGWDKLIAESWMMKTTAEDPILTTCEVLLTGVRDFSLMERRAEKGLKTFYMSERWFKPIRIGGAEGVALPLPGIVRMWVPRFRKMAKKFVKLVNESDNVRFLPIGPWAKKDFVRMGISLDKIVDWGYYVEPSDALPAEKSDGMLKLLWCGRLLGWKRVGDIVRAVGEHVGLKRVGDSLPNITLTIVGDGPEKPRLMKIAEKINSTVHLGSSPSPIITFLPPQPVWKIREIMREHDTFVFASDEYEGWGAVVSEALEEGMNVIGTFEAGASAAMLPKERLYHAGNVKELARLLELEVEGRVGERRLPDCSIGEWTASAAAKLLVGACNG